MTWANGMKKKNFITKGSLTTLLSKETHTRTSVKVSKYSCVDWVKNVHMGSSYFPCFLLIFYVLCEEWIYRTVERKEGSKQWWRAYFTALKLVNQSKNKHPGPDLGGCMEEHEHEYILSGLVWKKSSPSTELPAGSKKVKIWMPVDKSG